MKQLTLFFLSMILPQTNFNTVQKRCEIMRKFLFIFLTIGYAFSAVDLTSVYVDFNEIFASTRLQTIELFNQGSTSISVDVLTQHSELLEAGERKVIRASEGFVFFNATANESFSSIKVKNVTDKQNQAIVTEKKTVVVQPGQRHEVTVTSPCSVSGVRTQNTNVSWGTIEDKINVKFEDDLSSQLNFYKKYFMPDGRYTQAEILQDFTGQASGVTVSKRAEEVIFSLTSYPKRFEFTWLAIESLLRQTERPDRVVLNLFEGEFPGRLLPWSIRKQMERGLEINWCPVNFKVYLKVIPAIQKFSRAAVVAVDDDIIYPKEKLRDLMNGYKDHPDCIVAQEVREMTNFGGYIYPCCDWNFTGWNGSVDGRKLGPSNLLVPEGVTGVLFPPGSLHSISNDFSQFQALTPTEDDLWLYAALVLNNRRVVKIPSVELPYVIFDAHNMDSALSKINTANGYKVSTQCFYNLFHALNLKDFLGMDGFSRDSQEAKDRNHLLLSYGQFEIPRQPRSPISLLDGFSWTENWSGHKGGVWTDGPSASFSIVVPQNGFSRMNVKARFLKHPSLQKFINFRIKRNGYTIFRGEFDSEWFDFSLVDSFESHLQKYELSIDNPILASSCGFNDNRNLGVLIHQVNVEPITALSFNRTIASVEEHAVTEICEIDSAKQLLREGAANISFDYALNQCGINEQELKDRFSRLITNCHQTSIERQILPTRSIPFLHHRAWHTSREKPREVPNDILGIYIRSLKEMKRSNDSWQHIFWCNGKDLIPSTVSKLTDECPWLDVREVKDFPGAFVGKPFYELLMNDGRYTNANDVFRVSLIHEMGGIYLDLGFDVIHDISSWLQTYDSIVAMYPSGAIDHHVLGMAPFNKFTESYLRRLQNPKSLSKTLVNKWSKEPYFQQHIFFGASGFLVDLLERATETDKVLLVPETNPFIRRHNMGSWFAGNNFGNNPVEKSKVDLFRF